MWRPLQRCTAAQCRPARSERSWRTVAAIAAAARRRASGSGGGGGPVVKTTIHPNGVAHVTLSRPKKLNALNLDAFRELTAAAHRLRGDAAVRAVVLSGKGRAFCAGLDVRSVAGDWRAAFAELLDREEVRLDNLAQAVGYAWRQIDAPVVAALHGVCLGGGLQIALGADFRVAAPDCKMSVLEAKWGIIPDMSGSVTLRELVPIDVAKRLAWTAEFFTGADAGAMGLVDLISDDPVAAALERARELAESSSAPGDIKQEMLALRRDRFHDGSRVDAAADTTVAPTAVAPPGTAGAGSAEASVLAPDAELGAAFPTLTLPADGPLPRGLPEACRSVGLDRWSRAMLVRVVPARARAAARATDGGDDDPATDDGGGGGACPGEVADAFRSVPVPVIAVVSGRCGPGVSRVLLGADVRFGAANAALSVDPASADAATAARIRELCAPEDAQIGHGLEEALLTRVDGGGPAAAEAEARRLATLVARRSPDSVAAVKAMFNRTWHASERASLAEESVLQRELLLTYNQVAASLQSLRVPVVSRLARYGPRRVAWLDPSGGGA